MRLMLLLVGTVSAGAIGLTQGIIPIPTQMAQAITALGGDPAQIRPTQTRNVNLNPVEAYNKVLPQILNGRSPADLGFKGTAVTIPPGSFRGMNDATVNPGAIGQNGFTSSIQSQVQQNNIRMQDMANYARNPAGWHGAPPH